MGRLKHALQLPTAEQSFGNRARTNYLYIKSKLNFEPRWLDIQVGRAGNGFLQLQWSQLLLITWRRPQWTIQEVHAAVLIQADNWKFCYDIHQENVSNKHSSLCSPWALLGNWPAPPSLSWIRHSHLILRQWSVMWSVAVPRPRPSQYLANFLCSTLIMGLDVSVTQLGKKTAKPIFLLLVNLGKEMNLLH